MIEFVSPPSLLDSDSSQPAIVAESPNKHGETVYETAGGKRLREMVPTPPLWANIYSAEPTQWSRRTARERVRVWLTLPQSRAVGVLVLLGRRVCEAFSLPRNFEWLEWYGSAEHRHPMIAFPNPSPLNRWWNDKKSSEQAAILLSKVASGELPHYDHLTKETD